MASLVSILKPPFLSFLFTIISIFQHGSNGSDPVPATWPLQFHSILYMESNGTRQIVDLWYDWPNGRNFNIIQNQLGERLYDLEWGNGTSYFYTLDANRKCYSIRFPVGILRPDWLVGAEYLGQKTVDKLLCNVWTKVDFIWYYEDVVSKRPVAWEFFNGMSAHVMTFEVGKTLEDRYWQAPPYCFDEKEDERYFDTNDKASLNHLKSISMAL